MYYISVNKERPDFRVFIDLLYGAERNVDTDGDSIPVNSRTWTELYVNDRESNDPYVRIVESEQNPSTFEVESKSQQLETLAALYLYLYCGTSLKRGDHTLGQQEIEELKQRFAMQLRRAEYAVWHRSSNDRPYPNLEES